MVQTSAESSPAKSVQVNFSYSESFPEVLQGLNVCLLVSNYFDGGQVLAMGTHDGRLVTSLHAFEHALGIAAHPDRVAIATRREIYFLPASAYLATQLPPQGLYDNCLMARKSHITGEIQAHELGWAGGGLWIVNTAFSCLCTLNDEHSFVPRWKPPFISNLAAEDRCHLNGLAMENDRLRYASAMSETDTRDGWRDVKVGGGCLIDIPSSTVFARGFIMPHSPRSHDGKIWVLDSGRGNLTTVDRDNGRAEVVAKFPGYTRGLSFIGPYAFIGLSKVRRTSMIQGVPIAADPDSLHCGIRVVDLRTGSVVAALDFTSGVEEIFSVEPLQNTRMAAIVGPNPGKEGSNNLWFLP